jgi:ribosomal protein S18 acetylase RimI-like enzyme
MQKRIVLLAVACEHFTQLMHKRLKYDLPDTVTTRSCEACMDSLSRQNLTPAGVAAAATMNLVTHFSWVHRRLPGMVVRDEPDLVWVDSGLPCDTFNTVCRARLTGETARQRVGAVMDYFAGVNRPFSWWVSPGDEPAQLGDLLLAAGLVGAETELAMVADLDKLRAGDVFPAGLEIRRVRTEAQLEEFARIVAANWAPPDGDVLRFYARAAPALLVADAPLWFYVGYLGNIPVATSELTVGGGLAGLYNICTLSEYRRRGLGTAMTLQPLVEAQAQGYRTAILQASEAGARIYARVGFEAFGHITEYKPAR